MKKSITIVFWLIGLSVSAQLNDPVFYFTTVQHASSCFHGGNFQTGDSLYQVALEAEPHAFSFDVKHAISAAWSVRDTNRARELLYRYVGTFGALPQNDSQIDAVISICDRKRLRAGKEYANNNFDAKWAHEIDSLISIDQKLRNRNYINGTLYHEGYNIDSLNTLRLVELISEKGLPTEQRVGSDRTFYVNTIFLHADFDKGNVLLGNLLKAYVLSGHYDPRAYAGMVDRRQKMYGLPPIYYQIPMGFDDLSDEEKKAIHELRQEIGLGSVSKSVSWKVLPNGDIRISYH